MLILEEAAYCDEGFFYETVAPILSIGSASLVAISTLTSEINFYTRLIKMKDPATDRPLFAVFVCMQKTNDFRLLFLPSSRYARIFLETKRFGLLPRSSRWFCPQKVLPVLVFFILFFHFFICGNKTFRIVAPAVCDLQFAM